jgi:hypothetical protein
MKFRRRGIKIERERNVEKKKKKREEKRSGSIKIAQNNSVQHKTRKRLEEVGKHRCKCTPVGLPLKGGLQEEKHRKNNNQNKKNWQKKEKETETETPPTQPVFFALFCFSEKNTSETTLKSK